MTIPTSTSRTRNRLFVAGCCVLTAILFTAAHPHYGLFPLAYIALAPFLYAVRDRGPWGASLWGLLTGAVLWTLLVFWMRHIAWIALIGLVLYEAVWFALFANLWTRWRHPLRRALLGPVLWVTLEWLRSLTPLGFSWGALGLTHYRLPVMIQCAAWGGVPLLSYVIACGSFAAWYWLVSPERRGRVATALPLLWIPAVALGGWLSLRSAEAPKNREVVPPVAVVQGNIPAEEKLEMSWAETYWRHVDLSREALEALDTLKAPDSSGHAGDGDTRADHRLLVWPESVSVYPFLDQPVVLADLQRFLVDDDADLLVGTVEEIAFLDEESGRKRYTIYNSAYLVPREILPATPPSPLRLDEPFVPAEDLVRYDKVLLVPFGEYVPGKRFLPFIRQAVESLQGGAFTPGTEIVLFHWGDYKLGTLICFESTFSWHARAMVQDGADLLINITNDAWFQRTSAPWQHLSHSVFRAVENRVPLVRAANSGVSCFIDSRGRMVKELPVFEQGWLVHRPVLEPGGTFYSRYGDVFAVVLLIVLIGGSFLPPRKPDENGAASPVGEEGKE